MCLNMNDCQFKTSRYSYSSTYMNFMIKTHQNSAIDTQKLDRKEHSILVKKIIKPQRKKLKEKEKNKEELQKQPDNN